MFHSSARLAPRAAALTGSVLAILTTAVNAQAMTEWDLPEQPLAKSLREIAAQTDSNIIFDKKLVNDQSAPPLKMKATTEQALKQVLEGTGLTYRHLDDKTVTIQLASADSSATTSGSYGARDGRIRLAQAETGSATGPRTRMVEGKPLLDIEEIIVTGTNIRGIENNTAPVTVLSREYINATGFGTTAKLIESLPQNFAQANQSGVGIPEVSSTREQGSSINLRGLGEGATLVLLNGRRMAPGFKSAAVDISALPLTALDRVEVLTDGASALYGSDAVGGVVNFILRDDFEGVETRVRAGFADETEEYRVSQALGAAWDSGNALLSLEYYKRDQLLAADRDFIPSNSLIGSLLPEDENYSAVFSGRQELFGAVTAFADILYTQRDSSNQAGRTTFLETGEVDNPQGNATVGIEWAVGGDWVIELSGSYGRNDLNVERGGVNAARVPIDTTFDSLFVSEAARLKADGSLFEMPGGNLRAAVGADWRSESYEDSVTNLAGVVTSSTDTDQIVRSAFAELYVPLFGKGNAITGVQALEVSLAGRYDDYSSFGSSFDPQYGLMWEPVTGLRLRGRYGTSYKAPNLVDYSVATNSAAAITANDPGAPGGRSYQLQVGGIAVDSLTAQESESTSFGFELLPPSIEGLSVSVNYYRVKYTDRIATPVGAAALANPDAYAGLIIRNPSADQVNQLIALAQLGQGFFPFDPVNPARPNLNFSPDQIAVIVDARRRNLSLVDTNGLDLSTQYDFKVGASRIVLGLAGTYALSLDRQITPATAEIQAVDTFGNPPDWRARGYVSWQLGGWSANLFVNHTDSYVDNRRAVTVPVDSYTTVDARLGYSFSNRFSSGLLSGLSIAASVQNLADEDPPSTVIVNAASDLGFDTTNANPLGRFIALEITKTW
jgi:outer membrane receptor protein involved in Fe transport